MAIAWIPETDNPQVGPPQPRPELHWIEFDAIISSSHADTAKATKHSIESGAPVSDHVRPEPETLTLSVVVSNTPVRWPPAAAYSAPESRTNLKRDELRKAFLAQRKPAHVQEATSLELQWRDADLVPQTQRVQVRQFPEQLNRVQEVYEELLQLAARGQSVEVITKRRDYEGMVITSVTTTDDVTHGSSIALTISLQRVRVVNTEVTTAPKTTRARKKKRRGGKATKTANPKQQQNVSLWARVSGI